MRILYVLPSLLIGGAESLVSQWAGYLLRLGHCVEVCTLYTGGPFAARLKAEGVRIHNLNHDAGIAQDRLRRKYDPRLALSLAQVIREGSYQIVHAHLFPALFYMAFVSYLYPRPAYLYSEHSVYNRRRRYAAMKPIDRFLYSRCKQILPVSGGVRDALCRWLPELSRKVQVVPNTVNETQFMIGSDEIELLRRELDIAPGEQVVLFAGRLVPQKGADILIEAASLLARAAAQPLHLILAGEGPLRAQLEHRAAALPAPVRVTFLGNRGDIPNLLMLADLVVLPSLWEGLPMFLLEAMAAGKAVLATGVGGVPEAIEHAVSGWLAPAGDPTALADAMTYLLADKNLRENLGENARRVFAERYTPERSIEKLLHVYEQYI